MTKSFKSTSAMRKRNRLRGKKLRNKRFGSKKEQLRSKRQRKGQHESGNRNKKSKSPRSLVSHVNIMSRKRRSLYPQNKTRKKRLKSMESS